MPEFEVVAAELQGFTDVVWTVLDLANERGVAHFAQLDNGEPRDRRQAVRSLRASAGYARTERRRTRLRRVCRRLADYGRALASVSRSKRYSFES